MHVHFVAPEAASLDRLRCEALVLPVLSDERPLRGALGLVDWRLCGLISKLVVAGSVRTDALEATLLPGRPKLTVDKVFLFGAGTTADLDPKRQADLIGHMLDTASR